MSEQAKRTRREKFRSVTLPKDVVDEVEKFLEVHRDQLRRRGIKKISHMFERSWYDYKDKVLNNKLKLYLRGSK